jgi:hypothetical protein
MAAMLAAGRGTADRKEELERIIGLPRSIGLGNKFVRISTFEDVTPRKVAAFRDALKDGGASSLVAYIYSIPDDKSACMHYSCFYMLVHDGGAVRARSRYEMTSPTCHACHNFSSGILQACMNTMRAGRKRCAKGARTWNYWKKVREAFTDFVMMFGEVWCSAQLIINRQQHLQLDTQQSWATAVLEHKKTVEKEHRAQAVAELSKLTGWSL